MNPEPRSRGAVWTALLACLWDFAFAALCLRTALAWWDRAPWADAWLEGLRWWPAYEGLSFLVLLALFMVVSPDVAAAERWRRSISTWFWQTVFLTGCIAAIVGFSLTAYGDLGALWWFGAFALARSLAWLGSRDPRAFTGFVEVTNYFCLAIVPLGACGALIERVVRASDAAYERFYEIPQHEEGSFFLACAGVLFYAGYGAFHLAAARWPQLADGRLFTGLSADTGRT